ncbi:MAG TPA: signal peptidase II [Firmicutes bacterium]|nr:signal peptidase II [Bacillota bacterium]
MNKKILITAVIALIIDQLTKTLAELFLKLNVSFKVINKFFYFTLCHNEGAAFGLFSGSRIFIIVGTVIALLLLYHFTFCFKKNNRNNIAFGLIYGGLAGNFLDRIIFGYVIDFLDFYIFKLDYPVFNFADIAIVIGVILLVYATIRGEEVSENNSKKSK